MDDAVEPLKTIRLLCLVAPAWVTLGCGSGAAEQQLEKLHTDVVRLKADNAVLSQRLQALEAMPSSPRSARAAASSAPTDAPALAVVTLRPGGEAGGAPNLPEAILEPGPNGEVLEKTAPQPVSQP